MEVSRALKIYFLPFFARGHLIPLVHFARLLGSQGQQVTIITTPSNAQLLDKTIEEDRVTGHHISIHIIKFPSNQAGLPDGIENLFNAFDNKTAYKIVMAAYLVQSEIEAFMKENPPDVFIPDIMFTWSEASARSLGIPRFIFNPLSIFIICMAEAIKNHPEAFASDSGPYLIPNLPHPITLSIKPSPGFARIHESMVEAEKGSQGVIVNSFAELEVEYTQYYEKLTGRKVWHVGPTLLMLQKTEHNKVDDDDDDDDDDALKQKCLSWLNSKEQDSVVYISFGSMCRLSDEQLFQIATALEASEHQFLWVVHRKNSDKEKGDKWLPEGFEEKIKRENRGMLIKEWAPQPLILNHPSTGGFLTQCGWNAVVEAVSAGVPMITMPGFGDQYYIEKLITEVHGFGVEVGAAEWTISPYDAKKNVVSAERIEKAVKSLMDGGEEGARIRSKAKEMQEKALKAVQEGGSSYNSVTALIEHLKSLVLKPEN